MSKKKPFNVSSFAVVYQLLILICFMHTYNDFNEVLLFKCMYEEVGKRKIGKNNNCVDILNVFGVRPGFTPDFRTSSVTQNCGYWIKWKYIF